MTAQKENKSHHQIPDWLKKIQENSWELELLISGGAIFSLFQLSGSWVHWMESTNEFSAFLGRNTILLIGTLGLELLKIGFISHIILRAIWLSMVCVNYVYPEGIKKEKINWKKPFKADVQAREDLQSPIISVDRYCGIVIYVSISSAILLAGLIFCIFLFLAIPSILEWENIYGLYMQVILISLLLYVFDLITFGLLRRIPFITYLTYPIFTLLDLLTLRKIIQRAGFLFVSNIPKIKFYLSAIAMLTIGLTLGYLNTYRTLHQPNVLDGRDYLNQLSDGMSITPYYYRDEPVDKYRGNPSIQSKITHDNYLNVYIPYNIYLDDFLDGLDEPKENRLLSKIVSISIDSIPSKGVQWHESYYESENGISRNIGIECFISIGHLNDGPHTLKIYTNPIAVEQIEKNVELTPWAEIRLKRGLDILFIKDTELSIESK